MQVARREVMERAALRLGVRGEPAEQRRELFEEAAGVSKYKAKREEATRRLDKVDAYTQGQKQDKADPFTQGADRQADTYGYLSWNGDASYPKDAASQA